MTDETKTEEEQKLESRWAERERKLCELTELQIKEVASSTRVREESHEIYKKDVARGQELREQRALLEDAREQRDELHHVRYMADSQSAMAFRDWIVRQEKRNEWLNCRNSVLQGLYSRGDVGRIEALEISKEIAVTLHGAEPSVE